MNRAFAVFAAFAFMANSGGAGNGPRLDQFAGIWNNLLAKCEIKGGLNLLSSNVNIELG